MHLIQGFFVQILPGLQIGYPPGVGESVLMHNHLVSVMFAGTFSVDEAGTPSGYILDKFGQAILERIVFSDDRLEFMKRYVQNGRLEDNGTSYELQALGDNRWSGVYTVWENGDDLLHGTVECIVTEFDDEILEATAKRFAELNGVIVKPVEETHEEFADRLINKNRSTPLQS